MKWRPLTKREFPNHMDKHSTTIDLIRHGEPLGGRMYRGQKDDPLSELGWRQMRDATAHCNGWQKIVSSPLQRCARFAEELASVRQLPVSIEERFREISFGVWEGRTPAELEAENPVHMKKFWNDPITNWPAEGEPFDRFQARVAEAWDELLRGHAGQHLLLVAHGGVIRAILFHVLGMPPHNFFRVQIPYASVTRIRADNKGEFPHLVFHCGQP